MMNSELYLSKPGIALPKDCYDNAAITEMVKKNYKGNRVAWKAIEAAIGKILKRCNTELRYLDFDPNSRVADYAVQAAKNCLERNSTSVEDVDLVIFGGVAREYFEPATAMEVSMKLGIEETHAFDVTTACVGHLEAVQVACAYLNMHDHYQTALVCTSELSREFITYDIQSVSELQYKAAGLTIGNAASCFLVSKEPWSNGCVRIISTDTYSMPSHWKLCQVPIHGTFTSSSTDIMKLYKHIIPRLRILLDKLSWSANDIAHYIFHQPSEFMTQKILSKLGADLDRGVYTHHLYGNNASATTGVVFNHLLEQLEPSVDDKLMLGSAASGFTMATLAGIWV